jgi:hypothetical protein
LPILPQRSKLAGLSVPRWLRIVGFIVLHIPLAFVFQAVPEVGALHALASLGLGLFYAFFDKTPNRVALVAAYIVGAETLWRITFTPIFYEFSKYATVLILIVSTLNHLKLRRLPAAPFVYFALLVPSMFLALDRELISSNLSGPLVLAAAAIFFSRIQFTEARLHRLLLTMIAPIAGVATLASSSTATAPELDFHYEQTLKETAGGALPTHVAAVLGLGVVVIALYVLYRRPNRTMTVILGGLAVWFGAQSALTFSRGGLMLAGLTLAVAAAYSLKIRRLRRRLTLGAAAAGLIALIVVVPWLQNFTSGAFGGRFSNASSSGRGDLAKSDIMAFLENPVLGLGPGKSVAYHNKTFKRRGAIAHTEYTRLPAEHGSLGLLALLLLAAMSWPRFVRRPGLSCNAIYAASLTSWALGFMAYESMRVTAAGFLFGLGAAVVLSQKDLLVRSLRAQLRASALASPEQVRVSSPPGSLQELAEPEKA